MKKVIKQDSPFQELSGYYYEVFRLVKEKYIKNKTILDIGCGFGWFEWNFSKKGAKKIYGIEPDLDLIKQANKIKSKKIIFKEGSAIKIPFKKNFFDTIVSFEVLEHIPKNTENLMFTEMYRVLKPGGYVFLSTQHNNFFSTLLDPAWWFVGHRHYSKEKIKNFAQIAGFTVESIYTKGGLFSIISTLNLYASKWIFKRGLFFESLMYKKSMEEYSSKSGFYNIFLTCKKNG